MNKLLTMFLSFFIVIQELDGLKKSNNAVGCKARMAINAIYAANKKGEAWIKIQGPTETQNCLNPTKYNNADDYVIDCAMYYNNVVAPNRVILVSEVCNSINRTAFFFFFFFCYLFVFVVVVDVGACCFLLLL